MAVPYGETVSYTPDPGDGGAPLTLDAVDFSFRSLCGRAVLRWKYRPGSAVFLVWQEFRDASVYTDGVDVGEVFRAPVETVFLIRASYGFGR